jgi:hypothetical protein
MAKISPNGRSWEYQKCPKGVLCNLPSVSPESLWDSFKAGNLKKMKMYIEPSKMLAVTPRARSRLSSIHKNVVYVVYGSSYNIPSTNNRKVLFGAAPFPSISKMEDCSDLSPKFSVYLGVS